MSAQAELVFIAIFGVNLVVGTAGLVRARTRPARMSSLRTVLLSLALILLMIVRPEQLSPRMFALRMTIVWTLLAIVILSEVVEWRDRRLGKRQRDAG